MSTGETRIEAIIVAALDVPAGAARDQFLDRQCGQDPKLREAVEAVLRDMEAGVNVARDGEETITRVGAESIIQVSLDDAETAVPPEAAPAASTEFPFLAPPQQLGELGYLGSYRVLGVIGTGGMGAVFRAEDPHLRRQIALKVMLPECARDRNAKARFLREARSQAAVDHDNVVAIYQVGDEGGVPFIAMPLLKGGTLAEALRATPVLPVEEATRIAREMALGLAAAHGQQLVHRDIKPGNIWLEERSRRVKILDFGLARPEQESEVNALTGQGFVVGTPAYMSPEQASGETLDARTDVFSLGIVLYEMLTGQQPFTGKTPTATLVAVNTHHPLRPAELNPQVPADLDAFTMQLLAKNPAQRPASAAVVAEELAAIEAKRGLQVTIPGAVPAPPVPPVTGSPSSQTTQPLTPPPTAEAALREPTRKRKVFLLAGVGLLLLIAVGVASMLSSGNKKEPHRPGPTPEPKPTDGPLPVSSSAELAALLRSQDWVWGPPENLGPGVNSEVRDLAPTLTADELTIVFARNGKLMMSRRKRITEQFSKAEQLPESINKEVREEASISGDGLLLAFSAARGARKQNEIWLSERKSLDEPFGNPTWPGELGSHAWAISPVLSPDGRTLLVTAPRGTSGDIVMFTRNSRTEEFANQTVFPEPVNSLGQDVASYISDDRLLMIRCRMEKPAETRFFTRLSEKEPFGPPQQLSPLNPHRFWLSPDGMRLYFHSREIPDGYGDLDIWVMQRQRKKN
ncbi:MAG: serine/threonine-protein kinase [Gemmataceae bacterium]